MKLFLTSLFLISLISNKLFSQAIIPNDTTVAGGVDNYPNGKIAYEKYIMDNAKYPLIAEQYKIQVCVSIRFIIEKDGNLSHIQIYSGIGSGSEEEALRLIKQSGKWIPSNIKNNPVKTRCIVPITFYLDDGPKQTLIGKVTGTNKFEVTNIIKFTKAESFGMPVSETPDYLGKTIHFFGEINSRKEVSDTLVIYTCKDPGFGYPVISIPVIFQGKKAQIREKNLQIKGFIKGEGNVVNYDGKPAILINDKRNFVIKETLDF